MSDLDPDCGSGAQQEEERAELKKDMVYRNRSNEPGSGRVEEEAPEGQH